MGLSGAKQTQTGPKGGSDGKTGSEQERERERVCVGMCGLTISL